MCKFDFQLFPFDIQKCTLDFGISHEDMQSMDLIQAFEEPRYKGSNEVNQCTIENFKFLAQDGEKGRLIVQFTLKRQLINVFLTTLIPAMLINLVITFQANSTYIEIISFFIFRFVFLLLFTQKVRW